LEGYCRSGLLLHQRQHGKVLTCELRFLLLKHQFFFSFFQIYLLLFGCKLHGAGLFVCFLGLKFEFSCFSS
jgi:hypothetical protein